MVKRLFGRFVWLAFAAAGAAGAPLAVDLRKRIPVGAGRGGGSSDAAAILRTAIDGALGAVEPLDWLAVALGLGSDVPFFLAGTGALIEGTGERVTALGALLVFAAIALALPLSVQGVSA